MFKYTQLLALTLVTFFFSCTNVDQIDTTKAKSKMDAYKIKRISEPEIMDAMNTVSSSVFEAKKGKDCSEMNAKLSTLTEKYGLKLEFIHPSDYHTANDVEKKTLEALQFALADNKQIDPIPQKLDEEKYVYFFSQPQGGCNENTDSLGVWKLSVDRAKVIQAMF